MEAQLRQAEGQVYEGGSTWEYMLFWAQRYREQGYTDAQVTLLRDAHGSTHGTSIPPSLFLGLLLVFSCAMDHFQQRLSHCKLRPRVSMACCESVNSHSVSMKCHEMLNNMLCEKQLTTVQWSLHAA